MDRRVSLQYLDAIVTYLADTGISMYGISSDLAPYVTHPDLPWFHGQIDECAGSPALLERLSAVARPGALLEVRLNGGALAQAGWSLEDGAERVRQVLRAAGFGVRPPAILGPRELRACPTTWARRLACGRDPRALYFWGTYRG